MAAWPLPVRVITSEDGVPLLLSVIEPPDEPLDVGANVALKFSVAPGAIVLDVLNPTCPNPVPDTAI